MKYKNLAILPLFLAFSSPAMAASDGTLGPTSTGSLSVSISIPEKIQISKIKDLALADYTGSGSRSKADNVCVYTNKQSGTYQVTITGNGAGGAYTLDDGSGNLIPYEVLWNDESGGTGRVPVTSGVALTGQTGADTSSDNCSGSNTANVQVKVTNANMKIAQAGTYTGNIAIVVEPN